MLCLTCNKARLGVKLREPTGELAMFEEIWKERWHHCVNCGSNLGDELNVVFFAHIKSKGAHPELRLEKDNIQLLCFTCHRLYDQGTKAQYKLRSKNN
jgi:5-methylcytosine-specific restriction endonuclease McrA